MYVLAEKDYAEIVRQNKRNGWGFSKAMLLRLCKEHEKAYATGDERRTAMLEERLTDANFHHECGYLKARDYEGFRATVEEEFKQ